MKGAGLARHGLVGGVDRNTFAWKGILEKGDNHDPRGRLDAARTSAMRFDLKRSRTAWGSLRLVARARVVTFPDRAVKEGASHVSAWRNCNLEVLQPYLKRRERLSGHVKGEFKADWDIDKNVIPNADWAFDADGLAY